MNFFQRLFGATDARARITGAEYQARFFGGKEPHTLIDVRTAEEFGTGSIPGAINIPVQELGRRLEKVPADKPVVVYCRSGSRSASAADLLKRRGYEEVLDLGGIISWSSSGYPLKRGK